MMNKNVFVWVVLVVCLAFAVQAKTSFETSSSSASGIGLQIRQPTLISAKFGEDIHPHIHVFNASSGIPMILNTTCFLHMYNRTGDHILRLNTSTVESNFDYEFKIGAMNFSYIGLYSFIAQCQNSVSNIGGFVSGGIEITSDGMPFPDKIDNNGWLIAVILFPMILALFFMLTGFGIKEISGGLSYFFFLLSWVMLPVSYVVINLVVNEFGSYSGLMNIFDINILSIILWSMFGLIFVYLLWKVAKSFQQGKNEDFEEGKL